MEKRVNRNSSNTAIAGQLVARRHRGELWHRRVGSWRDERGDEKIEEARLGKGDEKGDYAKICGVKLPTYPAADVLVALSCA